MNAGQLRHLITVEDPIATQNDTGEEIVAWTRLDIVWGAIEPLRGRERVNDGILATMDTRIRLRWSPLMDQLTARCRLLHQGVVYNIHSIAQVDMRRREIEVLATSGANDG